MSLKCMSTMSELSPQAPTLLVSIRATFAQIKKLPPDYDFQMPALISHADDYGED
jgi:hypothetical protein